MKTLLKKLSLVGVVLGSCVAISPVSAQNGGDFAQCWADCADANPPGAARQACRQKYCIGDETPPTGGGTTPVGPWVCDAYKCYPANP
jgi:hypothetical protein